MSQSPIKPGLFGTKFTKDGLFFYTVAIPYKAGAIWNKTNYISLKKMESQSPIKPGLFGTENFTIELSQLLSQSPIKPGLFGTELEMVLLLLLKGRNPL